MWAVTCSGMWDIRENCHILKKSILCPETFPVSLGDVSPEKSWKHKFSSRFQVKLGKFLKVLLARDLFRGLVGMRKTRELW